MERQSKCSLTATPQLVKATYKNCPWCGEPIVGNTYARHHWLIKRGAIPKRKFALINVLVNVVPAHHACHDAFGQTREFQRRCLAYVSTIFSAEDILKWYNSVSTQTNLIQKDTTGEL